MAVELAFKLWLGIFKQDPSGTVLSSLPDPYKAFKWNLTSIIPSEYDYTNFNIGDTTIETLEKNTITQLSKSRHYDSGSITPPTVNLSTLLPADAKTIVATLDALTTVDDPFKVLVCAGVFKSETGGVRTYDVFHAATGVLTTDGGRNGEAKGTFSGSLGLQECHLPILGATDCAATMTFDTSSKITTLVPTVSGGNS